MKNTIFVIILIIIALIMVAAITQLNDRATMLEQRIQKLYQR